MATMFMAPPKVTQDDMNAAAKMMLGMGVADLEDIIAEFEPKPEFAAKVIVAAAKQMKAAKLRMGAPRAKGGATVHLA